MNILNQTTINIYWLIAILIWIVVWKGAALWRSAKNNNKVLFVLFLVINTFGIVPIIYLFTLWIKEKRLKKIVTPTSESIK